MCASLYKLASFFCIEITLVTLFVINVRKMVGKALGRVCGNFEMLCSDGIIDTCFGVKNQIKQQVVFFKRFFLKGFLKWHTCCFMLNTVGS